MSTVNMTSPALLASGANTAAPLARTVEVPGPQQDPSASITNDQAPESLNPTASFTPFTTQTLDDFW